MFVTLTRAARWGARECFSTPPQQAGRAASTSDVLRRRVWLTSTMFRAALEQKEHGDPAQLSHRANQAGAPSAREAKSRPLRNVEAILTQSFAAQAPPPHGAVCVTVM